MLALGASAHQAAWRAAHGRRLRPDQRPGRMVVLMGGFWLDVLGFITVFIVVILLIVACEHERH